MKLDRLQWAFDRCGIQPRTITHEFEGFRSLPRSHGVYSIWQGDLCVYVGQAGGGQGFRGRFEHHYNKAYGLQRSGTSHGAGWVYHRVTEGWQPATWHVEYFLTASAVHRTFLEAAMMLEFDPLCNDENHADRILVDSDRSQ